MHVHDKGQVGLLWIELVLLTITTNVILTTILTLRLCLVSEMIYHLRLSHYYIFINYLLFFYYYS